MCRRCDNAELECRSMKPDGVSWPMLFGARQIPMDAAKVIGDAVEQLIKRGEITERNRWQAVELWAANYLAEVGLE